MAQRKAILTRQLPSAPAYPGTTKRVGLRRKGAELCVAGERLRSLLGCGVDGVQRKPYKLAYCDGRRSKRERTKVARRYGPCCIEQLGDAAKRNPPLAALFRAAASIVLRVGGHKPVGNGGRHGRVVASVDELDHPEGAGDLANRKERRQRVAPPDGRVTYDRECKDAVDEGANQKGQLDERPHHQGR